MKQWYRCIAFDEDGEVMAMNLYVAESAEAAYQLFEDENAFLAPGKIEISRHIQTWEWDAAQGELPSWGSNTKSSCPETATRAPTQLSLPLMKKLTQRVANCFRDGSRRSTSE